MSRLPGHRSGCWIYECQRCGFEFWSDQISKEWTGLRVCDDCKDQRSPQERIRGRADKQRVPFSNHPPDVFLVTPITGDDL